MTSPPDVEEFEVRLRSMIAYRDSLAAELARVEAIIGGESRAYANATGAKVKPTIDQLRRQLTAGQRPANETSNGPLSGRPAHGVKDHD